MYKIGRLGRLGVTQRHGQCHHSADVIIIARNGATNV